VTGETEKDERSLIDLVVQPHQSDSGDRKGGQKLLSDPVDTEERKG
jgi:hypothetical protein